MTIDSENTNAVAPQFRHFGDSMEPFIAEWKNSQRSCIERQIAWLNRKLDWEIAAIDKIGRVLNGTFVRRKGMYDDQEYIIEGTFLECPILTGLFQLAELGQHEVESLFEDDDGMLRSIKKEMKAALLKIESKQSTEQKCELDRGRKDGLNKALAVETLVAVVEKPKENL